MERKPYSPPTLSHVDPSDPRVHAMLEEQAPLRTMRLEQRGPEWRLVIPGHVDDGQGHLRSVDDFLARYPVDVSDVRDVVETFMQHAPQHHALHLAAWVAYDAGEGWIWRAMEDLRATLERARPTFDAEHMADQQAAGGGFGGQ